VIKEYIIIRNDNYQELKILDKNLEIGRSFQFWQLTTDENDILYKNILPLTGSIISEISSKETEIFKHNAWLAEFWAGASNEMHDHSAEKWNYLGILTLSLGTADEYLQIVNNFGQTENIKFNVGDIIIIHRDRKHGLLTTNEKLQVVMIPFLL